MRKLIFSTAIFLAVGLALSTLEPREVAAGGPQNLRSYVGKYPSTLLREQPTVKSRLRRVLGKNFTFFMTRIQTEMQIESDEDSLVAVGCMAHSCGTEDAVMVINLADGKMHCAIRSAKYNGGYKVFSEDKQNISQALYHAMERY